jgi:fibronectin-binding autotransporter adhesin
MHSKSKAKLTAAVAAFTGSMFALNYSAHAQTDVWTGTSGVGNGSGSFALGSNWSLTVAPSGNDLADLSQENLTTTSTVTLDGAQTVGAMNFGNTNTTNSAGWVINTGTGGPLNLFGDNYNLFTVNQQAGQTETVTINADLSDSNDNLDELAKAGNGTLVLTGNSSALSGVVAVNNGVLELDFSHATLPTNILGDDGNDDAGATHLQLQGGTLLVNGGSTQTDSQTFSAGTATELGDSHIVFNQNSAASLSLNLGALTHNWASSLDIQLPTTGTVSMSFGTAGGLYPSETFGTAKSTGGLLVDSAGMAFATVNNGADWAAVTGAGPTYTIVPGSSISGFYTPSGPASLAGNADVGGNVTLPAGSTAISSLRFNGAASTVDIGGLLTSTLSTAGILMTPSASGNMVISDGTLTTPATNELFISQNSATNTLTISANITGGVDLLKSGAGTLVLSGTNTYTGWNYLNSGTVSITGGSIGISPFSGSAGDTYVGQAYGNTAVLDISNGATLTSGRTVMGGDPGNNAGGTGTINQSGGTINSNYWFSVGTFGTGTYNMTGGILNTNPAGFGVSELEISVFSSGSGTVNLSGNAQINIDHNGVLIFGDAGSTQNGTFNQNGGTVTCYSDGGTTVGGGGGVVMGQSGTGVYTYNLNAGTLTTPAVSHGTGTAVFNFNGGMLQAAESTAGFLGGLTTAEVLGGGAIINSNGYNIGISQPLIHDPSIVGADLGLTKLGAGTLQLSGASTYTGATTINAGTLQLPAAGVPQPIATYSFDDVTDPSGNQIPVNGQALAAGDIVVNTAPGRNPAFNGVVDNTNYVGGGVSGATLISAGAFGNALQLDGTGTSITVPSKIVDMSNGANWTFSAWVQTTSLGSSILSKNQTGATPWQTGNSVFYLGTNPISGSGGNLPTAVRFAGGFVQGNTPVADSFWHMVTFVDAGGNQTIYVDGQATSLNYTEFGGTDQSNQTLIGYDVDTLTTLDGNSNFAGNLDELNFYGSALSATQVNQLFTTNAVSTAGGGGQFLPSNTAVNIPNSGATLDLNSNNQTIGSLAGVAGSLVTLESGSLITGGNGGSTIFAGSITGTGGIAKEGAGTMTMSGTNGYSGGTTVDNGTLLIAAAGALPAASGVTVTGGTLKLGTSTGVETLSSLTINGSGVFDVNNNHIIVSYSPGTQAAADAEIRSYLVAGYAGGAWNGVGGLDSSAANTLFVSGNKHYGLGYADGADMNGSNPLVVGLGAGKVEVKYTLYGDANLDGVVNGTDFGILAAHFGDQVTAWDEGDFNYDGVVNGSDFGALAANFGQQANGTAVDLPASDYAALDAFAAANGLMADVPEPATAGLLAIGALGILGRRRRRIEAKA